MSESSSSSFSSQFHSTAINPDNGNLVNDTHVQDAANRRHHPTHSAVLSVIKDLPQTENQTDEKRFSPSSDEEGKSNNSNDAAFFPELKPNAETTDVTVAGSTDGLTNSYVDGANNDNPQESLRNSSSGESGTSGSTLTTRSTRKTSEKTDGSPTSDTLYLSAEEAFEESDTSYVNVEFSTETKAIESASSSAVSVAENAAENAIVNAAGSPRFLSPSDGNYWFRTTRRSSLALNKSSDVESCLCNNGCSCSNMAFRRASAFSHISSEFGSVCR